jgi:hypothetical protein
MNIRFIIFILLPVVAVGCAGVSSSRSDTQAYLLSFPKQLTPGEQVVAFGFDLRNGSILAVNRVPYDWNVSMLTEAADSTMTGTPNHSASAFQVMAPLQQFVTVREDRQPFDVTGYVVVTTGFTHERTNYFTKADFILEGIAPNTALEPTATAP